MTQQGGLARTGFAEHHERAATARIDGLEHSAEPLALAVPT
jgi:hypothetical protein